MKKNIKKLKEKTIKELETEAQKLEKEITKQKLEWKISQPKDTNALYKKRKNLAAVLTILTAKKELEKFKPRPTG